MTGRPTPNGGDSLGDAPGRGRLEIFKEHRKTLFAIAYRMLSSVSDAEDMLQDAFIRWQQAAEAEIRSPRAFLVTIVTRLCLNHLQSARVRREEYFGQWLPEPLLTESADDFSAVDQVDDSLSMAFLVLLERLTPIERAVLLLREVFEYDYPEIAEILAQTEVNCRQILRRARQHVAENRPRFDTSPHQRERLMKEFLQATSGGDLQRLVALLADDVTLRSDGGGKGPALPVEIRGADNVGRGLLGGSKKLVPPNLVIRLTRVNGELGIVSYLDRKPFAVITLALVDRKIHGIYIVSNPEKLAHLPALAS